MEELTQITQMDNDYCLICPKCQHRGDDGICIDGVWFFDSVSATDHCPEGGLYCCTNCINWCKKYGKKWFQDDVKRKWYRYTRSDVCRWAERDWEDSQRRTKNFVVHFTRKEAETKIEKAAAKKKKDSVSASTIKPDSQKTVVCSGGSSSVAIVHTRKRKYRTVDLVHPVNDTPVFTRGRYNPTSTFSSFDNAAKTIHEFLKMCHNTPTSPISDSVYNIITMQVKVLEGLVQTLKEHMR